MTEITFDINSNEEIWELIDKKFNSIYIHEFNPHEIIEWWKTDVKTKDGKILKNLFVRDMKMDIQTDLLGLKKILQLNSNQFDIYQFDKPISDTLVISNIPLNNLNNILKKNGLKHYFKIDFEMITIKSFDSDYILEIEKKIKI